MPGWAPEFKWEWPGDKKMTRGHWGETAGQLWRVLREAEGGFCDAPMKQLCG